MKEINQFHKERLTAVTGFLKWSRINSGISQQELADMSGIHKNSIVRYEGQNPVNLTLNTILQICEALGLSLSEVFY